MSILIDCRFLRLIFLLSTALIFILFLSIAYASKFFWGHRKHETINLPVYCILLFTKCLVCMRVCVCMLTAIK